MATKTKAVNTQPPINELNGTEAKKLSAYWNSLPPLVKSGLEGLTENERKAFDEMYGPAHRTVTMGYILLVCGGLHHAYLGHLGRQLLFWLSWFTMIIGAMWLIFDSVSMSTYIEKHNQDAAIKALSNIRTVGIVGHQ